MSRIDLDTIRQAIRAEAAASSTGGTALSPGAAQVLRPSRGAALARLPLVGPALRWLHGLVKAPARIRDLHQMSRQAAARLHSLQYDQDISRKDSESTARRIEERSLALTAAVAAAGQEAARAGEAARQISARTDNLLLALEAWRDLSRAATHKAEKRLDILATEVTRALEETVRLEEQAGRARAALAARLLELEEWRRWEDPGSVPGADELLGRVARGFRGDEALVTGRLRAHLPLVAEAPAVRAGGAVLDLGCGRGEWLALLRAAGIEASGVDASEAAVRHCQAAGLPARREDLIAALAGSAPGSLGAVTAIQVVEHLPFAAVVRLIDEARRVLAPGGLLLLETPNPDNVRIAASDFRLDPTHRQPFPARLLALLIEARGFERVSVRELHPMPEPEGSTLDPTVRAALWGPQVYAVVGWKAAADSSAAESSRATTSGA